MHRADIIDGPRGLAPRLLRCWANLLGDAWPVMLSRAGLLALGLADIVMVGQHGTTGLAHIAMGYAVFMPITITGVGAMTGIVAVTARHAGAGERVEVARTFRRGLAWAVAVGLACTLLTALADIWLRLIGQTPDLVAGGGSVAVWMAPGALFHVIFVACSFHLEATRRPLPGLILMAIANLMHFALNAVLIPGMFGLPEMGAEGAALSSTLARAFLAIGIVGYILRLPEQRALPRAGVWGAGGWAAGRELRRLGGAAGAAFAFETMGFAGLTQVAGLISPMALAAYSIGHQVESIVFMVALGLSVATAVRVGSACGAGRLDEARFTAWSGLALTMGLIACLGLPIMAGAEALGQLFSSDPEMIARTAPLFLILAVSIVFDGGQVVIGQCNRALGDGWGTTLRFFVAFWLVMFPLGTFLGLWTGWAERGLFVATAVGCGVAVLLFALRFQSLMRRLEARG